MNEMTERERVDPSTDWRETLRRRLEVEFGLREQVDRLVPRQDRESEELWSQRLRSMRQRLPTLGHFGGTALDTSVTLVQRGGLRITPAAPRPTPIVDESGRVRIRFRAFADLTPASVVSRAVLHLMARDGRASVHEAEVLSVTADGAIWEAEFHPDPNPGADQDLEGYQLHKAILLPASPPSDTD